jgi:hypothetical protein
MNSAGDLSATPSSPSDKSVLLTCTWPEVCLQLCRPATSPALALTDGEGLNAATVKTSYEIVISATIFTRIEKYISGGPQEGPFPANRNYRCDSAFGNNDCMDLDGVQLGRRWTGPCLTQFVNLFKALLDPKNFDKKWHIKCLDTCMKY